jgi:hypothetical protein
LLIESASDCGVPCGRCNTKAFLLLAGFARQRSARSLAVSAHVACSLAYSSGQGGGAKFGPNSTIRDDTHQYRVYWLHLKLTGNTDQTIHGDTRHYTVARLPRRIGFARVEKKAESTRLTITTNRHDRTSSTRDLLPRGWPCRRGVVVEVACDSDSHH